MRGLDGWLSSGEGIQEVTHGKILVFNECKGRCVQVWYVAVVLEGCPAKKQIER